LVGPLKPAAALDRLSDLVALHDLGLREPLPVASKTSFEYASARRRGAPPDEAVKVAAKEWENRRGWGEAADAEHDQVFGPAPPFAALWTPVPQPGDGAELWPLEPTRFAVLSRRWWDPMLEAEQQAVT
jgi:exodeoxyribonuclease V gamma subunit